MTLKEKQEYLRKNGNLVVLVATRKSAHTTSNSIRNVLNIGTIMGFTSRLTNALTIKKRR